MTAAKNKHTKHKSSRKQLNNTNWSRFSIISLTIVGIITLILIVLTWANTPSGQSVSDNNSLVSDIYESGNKQTHIKQEPLPSDVELDKIPGQIDGKAWLVMSENEKLDVVKRALSNWELTGVKVCRDAEWFIEALDMFYKDNHANTSQVKVSDAMSVLGLSGGAFAK
ncbi:hypothetical protein [Phosphitispora sp. TUW77]|uniref:hypothetical protein n=1 Tax=Phosphitispora sp. TUW77 TaxID=3152361 RepID=UPI003AB534B9